MQPSTQCANKNAPIIVYGEGSAAIFTIQALLQQNEHVVWAAGSGAKLIPMLPYVESDLALSALVQAEQFLNAGSFDHALEKGVFHRYSKNKSFKLIVPKDADSFPSEYRIAGLSIAEQEQALREHFENHSLITKVSSAPIVEFEIFEQGGKIQFANGFITEFKQFFYCDSFSELRNIPKLNTILKHQTTGVKTSSIQSVLQVVFTHSTPLMQNTDAGLFIPLTKEAGESAERFMMGYFIEPTKSVWTVQLDAEEVEENHEIMKKLRRMKQALNKAFDSPEFLPEGKKEFMQTVAKEQVRFEESYLVNAGSFKASSANSDFVLLSDSFGFSAAMERIAQQFSYQPMTIDGMASADLQTPDLSALPSREQPLPHFDHI